MLNEPLSDEPPRGQEGEAEEDEISFKIRAWLTLAILTSELLLAFNITMVLTKVHENAVCVTAVVLQQGGLLIVFFCFSPRFCFI